MNPLSLFNSTSLVFLGVLVLVSALLFIYFENKAKEQNHKISSMLSLVSSLTEEVHSIRRHIQSTTQTGGMIKQNNQYYENVVNDDGDDDDGDDDDDLVSVSDDDGEDDDGDDDDDDDDDDDGDEDDDGDDDDDDDDNKFDILEEMGSNVIEIGGNVKVLTLLQPIELVSDGEDNDGEDNDCEDNDDEDDNTEFDADDVLDDDLGSSEDEADKDKKEVTEDVKMFDLKSIHLEEPAIVDYKKLSIGKLKTVVAEKGLASDTSKMKKQDLLKLLGVD
jgi:hypothetical protein